MKDIRLVVVSGPSGSGKSTAVKALEDLGYYCVDNMPVGLLPRLMELLAHTGTIFKVAACVDVRERDFLKGFVPILGELRAAGYSVELIYLEASDDSLQRRFSETRRKHPLAPDESPAEGLKRERVLLDDVKSNADKVIDTTDFNVHQLRELIQDHFSGVSGEKMSVNVVSFGYKYGIPTDADLVFDIRFLPNPYFVESLKPLDGTDARIREYVLGSKETKEFLKRLKGFLEYLLPLYRTEGKSYLTIAIGCTGGRHRSVAVTDEIVKELHLAAILVRGRHRDIGKS